MSLDLLSRILRFFSSFLIFPHRILFRGGKVMAISSIDQERDQTVFAVDIADCGMNLVVR